MRILVSALFKRYKRKGTEGSPIVITMTSSQLVRFTEVQRFPPTYNKKFRKLQTKVNYVVDHQFSNSVGNLLQISESIDNEYERVVRDELQRVPNCAFFTVSIDSDQLKTSIFIPPHKPDNFHKEDFANTIAKVLNSNQHFLLSQKLYLTFNHVLKVSGAGKSSVKFGGNLRAPMKIGDHGKKCRYVHVVKNNDNSCLLRAIVIAIYFSLKGRDKHWRCYSRKSSREQTYAAQKLAHDCGLPFDGALNLSHLKRIDDYFGVNYKITVVDQQNKYNKLFEGTAAARNLYLEYSDNHFNVITNIRKYMAVKNQFCEKCFKSYTYRSIHNCIYSCDMCMGEPHDFVSPTVKCIDCNRQFQGQLCFDNHKLLDACGKKKKCEKCFFEFTTDKEHVCGIYKCYNCKEDYTSQPHYCFVKPLSTAKLMEEDAQFPPFYLFFDIESITKKEDENGKKFHQPVLLISRMCCDNCYDQDCKTTTNCPVCDGETIFYSTDCITNFVLYLMEKAKEVDRAKGNLIVFAHYAKGYDAQFILREIIAQKYKPEIICQGLKILHIKLGNIRFLDSISYLLQSLKSLPKTFGFKELVEKGEFPHNFALEENLEYIGKLPPIEAYGIDNMTPESSAALRQWHYQNKDNNFNFKEEMINYCKKDVQVLMLAIMTLKNLFFKITNLNPFTRTFTLASAGMECIRSSFLKEKFLHMTSSPPIYFQDKRSSKLANIWLDILDSTRKTKLIREYRIGTYYADAADPARKIVYEFTGCYWHHCPCSSRSDAEKYSEYLSKLAKIESMGWDVEEMKECDFIKKYEKTSIFKERKKYYSLIKKYGACNITEAFFGGRCTNFCFVRNCTDDEVMEYFDVNSEYPFCLKYRPLPFGVPQEITTNIDITLKSYGNLGFAKVCILPPKNLLFPVLPSRINKKQVYTLCKTCAELEQQTTCNHSQKERCLINTYTLCELKEALNKKYKIIWISQVLVYEETDLNPYKDYVNLFLKIKQEASGWPEWVKTERDQDKYIDNFFEREGVKLDKENVKFNAGLRFIAKIFLNSSWGKLAQRKNMTTKEVCNTYDDYLKILNDESKIVLGDVEIENDTLLVSWKYKDDEDARSINTNLAVASHVTSWARLHLYKFMCMTLENYGDNSLLYIDTDSLVYVRKKSQQPLPTGNFLGDLTDEYPGCSIQKFVSTGSKSYGLEYLTSSKEKKCLIKIKGIRLTVAALDYINLETIINLAVEYIKGNVLNINTPQFEIRPTKKHELYSRLFLKSFKPTSTKRIINSGKTLPYGFVS